MTIAWPANALTWLQALLSLAIAIGIALVVHWVAFFIGRRAVKRTRTQVDDVLLLHLRKPTRWLLIAFALSAVQPALPLSPSGDRLWLRLFGLLMPALFGWLCVALLGAANMIVHAGTDITVEDNLKARRRRTRASILYRILLFVVMLVTFCMMLMSIPSVRSLGVTLIASAGLAGLAVGAAAQPALKNLIAGIQMAFTEPIRIDDVVIINGEWGRIEEIRLTFVVVKIWDERRLVVPVSKFLEESFQNWTRETSQIMGSVFWYVDATADVPRLRAKLEEVVRSDPLWDRRFFNLQVTDTKPDGAMELRGLMTAKDASQAFDLRCAVREAMLAFIRDEMPEALPRRRALLELARPDLP
ncbi:mechanosensitive ion channel domain-containing protein [uncultured Sphingomonas sp.]|uniref:mechanosensitive ion channel family protein n=1 Tax=uncultured Sphingomonas sp. TaxID=158754 RepID=UPI002600438D|nr:mechanosensitive ion channel domain-containing protein [uncultured Sphingomonas sp.]